MMHSITTNQVREILQQVKDPATGLSLLDRDSFSEIACHDNQVSLKLRLSTFSYMLRDDIQAAYVPRLKELGASEVHSQIECVTDRIEPRADTGMAVRAVIAVGSGKGGVGKSTIAASLALGLKRAQCRVGLLDADMYGPSVPHLLGIDHRPEERDGKLVPAEVDGMRVMSIGYFVPREEAVVWRGPMLHGMMNKFVRDTHWGELDYLIIDMPPGTGDIALSLSQMMPPTGAVIVCTPQEVALLDAVKAIAMFRKLNINVLGMVENMSGFICPTCDRRYDIFGSGGARRRAEQLKVPFLGEVPITMSIRENGDAGATRANFDDPILAPYLHQIVLQLARNVATLNAIKAGQAALPVL